MSEHSRRVAVVAGVLLVSAALSFVYIGYQRKHADAIHSAEAILILDRAPSAFLMGAMTASRFAVSDGRFISLYLHSDSAARSASARHVRRGWIALSCCEGLLQARSDGQATPSISSITQGQAAVREFPAIRRFVHGKGGTVRFRNETQTTDALIEAVRFETQAAATTFVDEYPRHAHLVGSVLRR